MTMTIRQFAGMREQYDEAADTGPAAQHLTEK
jgi:hypothetical protein